MRKKKSAAKTWNYNINDNDNDEAPEQNAVESD